MSRDVKVSVLSETIDAVVANVAAQVASRKLRSGDAIVNFVRDAGNPETEQATLDSLLRMTQQLGKL